MRKTLLGLALAMAMIIFAAVNFVSADTLFTFVGDCTSIDCFGATYTVIVGDGGDGTTGAGSTTYDARLIIDATGYSGPISPPVYIDAVDIKLVNTLINNTFALTDAPGGVTNWETFFNQQQAATDCGKGGGFFFCVRDPDPNNLAPIPNVWHWDWTFSSNDTIAFHHIGASYNNAAGTIEGNNVSIENAFETPGTPVPEPATLLLLSSGLLIMWAKRAIWRQ